MSSSFSQCVASSSLRQPSAGQLSTLFDYSPSVLMKKTLNAQSLGLLSVIIPQILIQSNTTLHILSVARETQISFQNFFSKRGRQAVTVHDIGMPTFSVAA